MKELIEKFSKQLSQALQIGEQSRLSKAKTPINNIVISGMGGSGIGGTMVAELVAQKAKVPIIINKDYFLPAFTSESTLVIISSYSGNTEETLQSFEIALDKKAKIVCITSGGKILDLAKETNTDFILIPGGMPPRSCLGYSFTQLFYVLNFFGIVDNGFKTQIQDAINLLDSEEGNIRESAKDMAGKLFGKRPVIYSAAGMEAVAIRFRQQINENAKMLCWHHVIPEMNHNELVGWTEENDELAVVIFRNETDYHRTQKRIEINKEIISKYTPNIYELDSKGNSPIERALYLVHLGDWISYYLGEKRMVDVTEVKVIDYLKSSLAEEL